MELFRGSVLASRHPCAGQNPRSVLVIGRPAPSRDPHSDVLFAMEVQQLQGTQQQKRLIQVAVSTKHHVNVVDGIPLLALAKGLWVWVFEGSGKAQEVLDNFVDIWKNHKLEFVDDLTDPIPVVGHLKGLIEIAIGHGEEGLATIESANRSAVVIGAGMVAFPFGGPFASGAAGIAAGTAYDSLISLKKGHPQGIWDLIDDHSAGNVFDKIILVSGDGLMGRAAGEPGGAVGRNAESTSVRKGTSSARKITAQGSSSPPEGIAITRTGDGLQLVEPVARGLSQVARESAHQRGLPSVDNLHFRGQKITPEVENISVKLREMRKGIDANLDKVFVDKLISLAPDALETTRYRPLKLALDLIGATRWNRTMTGVLGQLQAAFTELSKSHPLQAGFVRAVVTENGKTFVRIVSFVDKPIKNILDLRAVPYQAGAQQLKAQCELLVESEDGSKEWYPAEMVSQAARDLYVEQSGVASQRILRVISQRRGWVQVQWHDGTVESLPQRKVWAELTNNPSGKSAAGDFNFQRFDDSPKNDPELNGSGGKQPSDRTPGSGDDEGNSDEEDLAYKFGLLSSLQIFREALQIMSHYIKELQDRIASLDDDTSRDNHPDRPLRRRNEPLRDPSLRNIMERLDQADVAFLNAIGETNEQAFHTPLVMQAINLMFETLGFLTVTLRNQYAGSVGHRYEISVVTGLMTTLMYNMLRISP